MSKRKPVEAWAVVWADGDITLHSSNDRALAVVKSVQGSGLGGRVKRIARLREVVQTQRQSAALRNRMRVAAEAVMAEHDEETTGSVALDNLINVAMEGAKGPSPRWLSPEDRAKVAEVLVRIRDRIGTSGIESEWANEALALLREGK